MLQIQASRADSTSAYGRSSRAPVADKAHEAPPLRVTAKSSRGTTTDRAEQADDEQLSREERDHTPASHIRVDGIGVARRPPQRADHRTARNGAIRAAAWTACMIPALVSDAVVLVDARVRHLDLESPAPAGARRVRDGPAPEIVRMARFKRCEDDDLWDGVGFPGSDAVFLERFGVGLRPCAARGSRIARRGAAARARIWNKPPFDETVTRPERPLRSRCSQHEKSYEHEHQIPPVSNF